jgi:hypothetical protein
MSFLLFIFPSSVAAGSDPLETLTLPRPVKVAFSIAFPSIQGPKSLLQEHLFLHLKY